MPLTDAGRHAGLDGLAAAALYASLHDDDPSNTGVNELTGGSPAYARKAISYAASASGQKASNTALTFDIPAGSEVRYMGLWSALTTGTFYGWYPVGGQSQFAATFAASSDTFTSYAHGLSNGDMVVLYDVLATGLTAEFVEGTVYYVVGATTDTYQLAATAGGAAITSTNNFECISQKMVSEVFAAQGQYQVPSGSLVLDARLV